MDTVTYPDPVVQAALETCVVVKLDVKADADAVQALEVESVPTTIVFSAGGRELDRLSGFVPPEDYAARIAAVD